MATEAMALGEDHPYTVSETEGKKHSTQRERQASRKERGER